MKTHTQMLKLLLRAWDQGPAQQFEVATRYTRMFPKRVVGWIILADGLGSMARFREAEEALRQADRVMPPKHRWHVAIQWGHLYRKKPDEKRAERWYRKAVMLSPTPGNYIFLGAILARQGRFIEAKKQYRRALQLAKHGDKDSASEAYLNLGFIYRAERKYREAVLALRKAIQLDPLYKDALDALKDVQQAMRFREVRVSNSGTRTK